LLGQLFKLFLLRAYPNRTQNPGSDSTVAAMLTRSSAAALAGAGLVIQLTPPALALAQAPAANAAATRVIAGPTENMKWGPVRVKITVSGRKITGVSASYPTERSRSAQINQRAIPTLRSEVLKAQSARIHTVGGATMTSNAYILSLRAAVKKI
jgi:uncharacterized protein with FMN-binding domain